MKHDFFQMKHICQTNGSKLIFVNLPMAEPCGHLVTRSPEFDKFRDVSGNSTFIDRLYRSIAKEVNIPDIELSSRFKALPNKSGYFFRFDAHPNKSGYKEIAEGIGEILMRDDFKRP